MNCTPETRRQGWTWDAWGPSTASSLSSHCARSQEGTQTEQGDFVPISKNPTTQLGGTDGNNYNKAEKES